jgi:PAS domain S-box-containing protein
MAMPTINSMHPFVKLKILYISTTIFLIVLSFIVFKQIDRLVDYARSVNNITSLSLELEKLIGNLKDAESGQRGYLLTRDPIFLKPLHKGLAEYPVHLKMVRKLTIDKEYQYKNILEIERISHQRSEYLLRMLQSDKTRKPTLAELVYGNSIMDSLRRQVSIMVEVENKLLIHNSYLFERQSIFTPIFLLTISLCALGMLTYSYYKLHKELAKSLAMQRNQQLMVQDAPSFISLLRGPNYVFEMANTEFMSIVGNRDIIGKTVREAIPELEGQGFREILDEVYQTGKPFIGREMPVKLLDRDGVLRNSYVSFQYRVSVDPNGQTDGILIYGEDVTQQVQAKMHLKASEERYRNLIQNSPIAIGILMGEDLVITTANDAIMNIWGKGSEVIGKKYFEVLPELADQGFREIFSNVYNTGITFRAIEAPILIVHNQRPTYKYYDFVLYPQRDETGSIEGIGMIATDVTAQALLNKKIQESEEQLRIAIEGGELGTFDFDYQTKKLSWSTKTKELFGLPPEAEIEYEMYLNAIHPEDLEKSTQVEDILDSHGQRIYEKEFRTIGINDGKLRWVRTKGRTTYDANGNPLRSVGVVQDVTLRKQEEQTLRESESRFRLLTETLPQLIWVTDARGVYEYASQRWEEYSGMLPHGSMDWSSIVHSDDLELVKSTWSHCLLTGKMYKCDMRLRSKTGEYRWFTVNGLPVFGEGNGIVKWVGAFTDMHAEKIFSEELENQVKLRMHELALKNADLEKMNKELESFTYVSGHDLQEPLRKIQTFSGRILQTESTGLSETGKDYFRRIQNAANRMQRLIEDLLAFSRASTGERKFEKVKLNTIVEEVKLELRDSISEKQAVIEVTDLCELTIIPFQFRQLLHNLIGNALKFSKEGHPPHIIVDSENVLLQDAFEKNHALKNITAALTRPEAKFCHIWVKDNGIGFDQQYSQRIFQLFQRLHGKSEYAGTGIGLAIVKKIVENHEGFITATGEVGKGATFDIYIPLKLEGAKSI